MRVKAVATVFLGTPVLTTTVYKRTSRLEHSSTLITVRNLSTLYKMQGELADMIELVSVWGSQITNLFGGLGRLLIQNLDDSNAQVAFQHELVLQDGCMIFANISCDKCGFSVTNATRRNVCRRCPDIDLCGKCLVEHQTGVQEVLTCLDHSFLEIVPEEGFGWKQGNMTRGTWTASWLRDLTVRYPKKLPRNDET